MVSTSPPRLRRPRPQVRRPRPEAFAPGWVWLLAASSYVQAAALLLAGFSAGVLSTSRGMVGTDLVGDQLHRPLGVVLLGLGLVSLVAGVLVVLGHAWGLTALFGSGLVGTLALATLGSWGALIVPLSMLFSAAVALCTPALDHLHADGDVDG